MAIFEKKHRKLSSANLHGYTLINQTIKCRILLKIKGHRNILQQRQRSPVHNFATTLDVLNVYIFSVGFVLSLSHRRCEITLHERENIVAHDVVATNRSLVSDLQQKSESFFKARQ